MNIVEAFRASKDGRIRWRSWLNAGDWIKWESPQWVNEIGTTYNMLQSYMFDDDWEPYVEKPETPEEMMRRVAREEISKIQVQYRGHFASPWEESVSYRVIIPGKSDD